MSFSRERRQSVAERKPSVLYVPPIIPHLAGLEKPQELSLKIDECDVLITGTGLVESILAAALAWQGVKILHLDSQPYYGDMTSTLTTEQLKKWCLEVNQGQCPHFQDAQLYLPGGPGRALNSKEYGIDLSPKIMFAQSDLLSLLIKSRVYKYLEFQSLSNFHVFENDSFSTKMFGSTKEDIFTDQSLSLVTKRYLMRFLKFALANNTDPTKKQILQENSSVPIEEFLETKFNLHDPQVKELIYSIGLCVKEPTRTPEALTRIRRFLVSFDVYGQFPAMILKYGGPGELSQGFCRSAAVAGTTYKLSTTLADYDPEQHIAKLSDGSSIKVNEKLIISPSQIPRFLRKSYDEAAKPLKPNYVSRLITVVKKDCHEWMSEQGTSAVVVFPPHSLPTDNRIAVQALIENAGAGVCPPGQSIWFLHSNEQDLTKAKSDLASALDKMTTAILRESSADIGEELDEKDFVFNAEGTPVVANSFKLGESLQSFVPKEKLEVIFKLAFVQKTYVKMDFSNVLLPSPQNNISCARVGDSDDIIFTNMPSGEISYDGIVSMSKLLYSKITGTDEDFFDIDFEDEDDEYNNQQVLSAAPSRSINGETAIDEDAVMTSDIGSEDVDDDHHKPFGAEEMEL